jgi:hypothetical protein
MRSLPQLLLLLSLPAGSELIEGAVAAVSIYN